MHTGPHTRDKFTGGEERTVLCDWGSSRLRAFLQVDGCIVDRREGPGIGTLPDNPLGTLREVFRPWRESGAFDRITLCGMVGSRNGIVEVPYAPTPAGCREWAEHGLAHQVEDLSLLIGAGICGANMSGAPDVMRGEETQIFGAIDGDAALAQGTHTLLLPGTHSKWVQVVDGKITSIQTYITGELFALLRDYSSLLRAGDSSRPEAGGFAAGLARASHGGLAESLFETRAAQLTLGKSPAWAREFVSGVLIGSEVRSALRARAPASVVLIGDDALAALYRQAFATTEVAVNCLDADRCVVAGLRLLASKFNGVRS